MKPILLTVYVLVWPLLSAVVMGGLVWSVLRDIKEARRTGDQLV